MKQKLIQFLSAELYWLVLGCNWSALFYSVFTGQRMEDPGYYDFESKIFFKALLLIQSASIVIAVLLKHGFIKYLVYLVNILFLMQWVLPDLWEMLSATD